MLQRFNGCLLSISAVRMSKPEHRQTFAAAAASAHLFWRLGSIMRLIGRYLFTAVQ
jgi:hypothetical protein